LLYQPAVIGFSLVVGRGVRRVERIGDGQRHFTEGSCILNRDDIPGLYALYWQAVKRITYRPPQMTLRPRLTVLRGRACEGQRVRGQRDQLKEDAVIVCPFR